MKNIRKLFALLFILLLTAGFAYAGPPYFSTVTTNVFDGNSPELTVTGGLTTAITGTASCTNGSANVTGLGTTFTDYIKGEAIKINSDVSAGYEIFTILTVTDNTHIILDSNYQGSTASGLAMFSDGTCLLTVKGGDSKTRFCIQRDDVLQLTFYGDIESSLIVTNANDGTDISTGFKTINNADEFGIFSSFAASYDGGGFLGHLAGRLGMGAVDLDGLDIISGDANGDIKFYSGGLIPANNNMTLSKTGDLSLPNGNIITHNQCAEMYLFENTTATTIEDDAQWHPAYGMTEGVVSGFTYHAGSKTAISAFDDYSGTVAGTIKATTSAAHNYTTGFPVAILGSNVATGGANEYYGLYLITVIDADEFYFTNANWNATTTAQAVLPSRFLALPDSDGNYLFNGTASVAAAANSQTIDFRLFSNVTGSQKSEARYEAKTSGEYQVLAGSSILSVTEGDFIWFGVKNITSDANLTIRYSNVNITRLN